MRSNYSDTSENDWFFQHFEDPVYSAWRAEQSELQASIIGGGALLTTAAVDYYMGEQTSRE